MILHPRYSKTSASKWQNRYSDEFKQFVCSEFLTGTETRISTEAKYNIGNSSLTKWLKDLGYDYSKPSIVPLPPSWADSRRSCPD